MVASRGRRGSAISLIKVTAEDLHSLSGQVSTASTQIQDQLARLLNNAGTQDQSTEDTIPRLDAVDLSLSVREVARRVVGRQAAPLVPGCP
jgi:hypothetical protein